MSEKTHECPHPECKEQVPDKFYCCEFHWGSLPSEIMLQIVGAERENDKRALGRASIKAKRFWKAMTQ